MKQRLFTPGPTPVPEDVLLRMARPLIHHRSPEFREMMERVDRNLQTVLQTTGPVLILTASGTGGMEALFVNLFSPGETLVSVNGGKFGERWVIMPRTFGLNVAEITVPWGKAVSAEQVAAALRAHPKTRGVVLTHSETSTGTAIDVREIARAIREESDALICVDAITSIGAHEFRFDAWGIDACVTGSQKGLMIPPGLACLALSPRAVDAMERSTMPRFYFDLRRALAAWRTHDTPWTPASTLIAGLDTALTMLLAEGMEGVWSRHRRLALALREGVAALGLRLFSDSPSYAVTPVWVPEGVSWKVFNRALKLVNGITVAGGQGEYRDKIFRISHLGYYDDLDMVTVVAGLELALSSCGFRFSAGAGVAAVEAALIREAGPGRADSPAGHVSG
jgi:aspartate aminotransferase-like enzyme